jgi:hypothetical protein
MSSNEVFAIVKVDTRPHRTIARENWDLTKEQMKGMHVHHRIPVSNGGTNDPSNLYVCSPKFHAEVWHNGDEFTKWANKGGRIGGKKGGTKTAELGVGVHGRSAEQMTEDGRKGGRKGGAKTAELGVGIHARSAEQMTEDSRKGGKKGGRKATELGVGIHAPGVQSKGGKKGGTKTAELGVGVHAPGTASKGGKTATSQKWMCLVTGHISNPCGLSSWQKARGIDTSMRVKVG